MDLINLKDVSDLNVNFNVKIIDIDFYNISKRKIFLGHAGDYNLYVLHLIIPKDSDWADPMQIILSYQNNTLSKAKWVANPSKIVGNSYYFLINGDIVSIAGEGFLQFQVVLPSNDAATKTVIAKSKKIPYVVEESLTLEGSAEEVTPEQMSSIDSLITDYTNMLESYDLNDIFELERRVEVLEGLHGSENIYNPFEEYDIVELQFLNNVYNVIEPTHDLTTIKPSRVIETSASVYNGRQFLRLNDFETRAGDKLTLTGKVIVNKAKENFEADRVMVCCIVNQSTEIPSNDVVGNIELKESLYDNIYIGILGKEGWFSYTTTLEEDGNYLIFGACAQSRQLVGDGTSSNPYAPIKISNLKLIRENEDEDETSEEQSSFFPRYSKNDLEKAYKEIIPVSIYKQDKVLDYLKRAREKKEYYLIDSNSYADGISIIDDASFIAPSDTTNYSIPSPYFLSVPSNSSTVEFFNTQTKENWIYEIEQGQTEFEVKNLIPEHLYVYTFKNSNGNIIESDCLKIKGPIRFIDVGVNNNEEEIVNNIELKPESTIFNVRDLGGWKCDRGKLKYGVIYRGSTLSELYEGTAISLSSSQKQFLVDKLKIRDEISLRWTSEISGRTSSVLNGVNGQQVGYKNFDIGYYNPLTGSRPGIIADIIKRLSNNILNNRTTYIHCSAGADRTALICSIIEAICGVSQIDLDCDYEISSLAMDRKNPSRKSGGATTYGERLRRDIDPYGTNTEGGWGRGYLFQKLRDKGHGNLRDGTINFLLENGVTREEIDIIRAGLIEYEEPEELLIDNVIENNINEVTHNKLYVPTTEAVINYISDPDNEIITRNELFSYSENSQLINFTPCEISLSPVSAQLKVERNKIKFLLSGGQAGTVSKKTLNLEEDITLYAGELYQFTLSRTSGSTGIAIDLVDEEQNVYKTYTLNSNTPISDKIQIGSSNITIHQFYCIPVPSNNLPVGEYTLTLTHITTIKEELLGLERFIEKGEVDSQLISDSGGPHKMTGNYMLKDGFCYLTVKAQLIEGWVDSSYPLPVSAIKNATTVASNGTRLYEISLGLTNNGAEATYLTISPLERKFAPNPTTGVYASGDPIYFTFCYQYQ